MAMQADFTSICPWYASMFIEYSPIWLHEKKMDVCNFSMNSIWLKLCSMPNIFSYVLVSVKLGYDINVYRVNLKL